MKFKVGDRVRIRKDLKPDTQYGNSWTSLVMHKYAGIIDTVKNITISNTYHFGLIPYSWSDEMIEAIEEEEILTLDL